MSHTAQPITPARFASALPALPLSTLHETAAQTRNSIAHLQSSNAELRPHADEGDDVCREAIEENEVVVERMRGRMEMLRAEVEGRGMKWVEDEDGGSREGMRVNGDHGTTEQEERPEAGDLISNGQTDSTNNGNANSGPAVNQSRTGELSDEQLRRRLEERMGDLEGDEEEGMHL